MSSSFLSTGLWRAGVPVFLECEGPFLAPQSFRLHLLCDVGVVAEIMVVTFVAVADFNGSTAEVFILRRSERSCVSVRLQMVEGHCSCSGAPTVCRHVGEVQPCSAAMVDRQGCDPGTRFLVPPRTVQWVALLQRGNCTFKEKILKAASFNATAVLIYNNSTEETVMMGHEGTGDTVAVMIPEAYGKDILAHLDRNLTVLVSVVFKTTKNNRGSLVFVSISFIVLMIISSAWLIFYFIQKIRYSSSHDRSQRHLGDAAKKAIGKLTTRTVKKGDKETDPDFNHCAVCIEAYQLNDVVRILPCKHVFHKMCVDPWLNEHCTCPICKLNILKALGIMTSLPCVDSVVLDVERLGISQASGSHRMLLGDSNQPSLNLDQLSPPHTEATPRTPAEVSIAVSSKTTHIWMKGWRKDGQDEADHLKCVCVVRPGPLLQQELDVSSQHPV
uniref:Ring finger protein 130 n=1 Tax=Takifugu rubripes TaxID=31033 RepID=A0A674PFU7_TAKRU